MEFRRTQVDLDLPVPAGDPVPTGRVEIVHAREIPCTGALHIHGRTSIALVLGRDQVFETVDGKRLAPVGSVLVAPAGWAHGNTAAAGRAIEYLAFEFDPRIEPYLHGEGGEPAESDLARTLSEAGWVAFDPLVPAVERGKLVWAALRSAAARVAEARQRVESRATWEMCRDHIHKHLTQPIALADLARLAGCHPDSVSRGFKRELGIPPHRYLLSARLDLARQQLVAGERAVQAAMGAGFADQSHLTRHFQRQFGITPGRFQRGVRNVQANGA